MGSGGKPKAEHELTYWRPSRHAHRLPQPGGSLVRPDEMPKVGLELWDAVVPELEKLNYVSALDQTQMECMCEWWIEYRHWCEQETSKEVLEAKRKAYTLFLEIASKFGLTPTDRRKLRPREPKKEESEFTKFLNNKGVAAG